MDKKKVEEEIASITKQIVEKYKPEKIILFGSAARGRMSADSDVDLLVIKKTNEPFWERQIRVTTMYRGWTPTDIFVVTPAEYRKAVLENRFFLTEEILKKGRVVYER